MEPTPPKEILDETRLGYESFLQWLDSRDGLSKLRRAWAKCSPEAQAEFVHHIEFQTGKSPNMTTLWEDTTQLTRHDKYRVLAEAARPLMAWWKSQGNEVSRTVYGNPKKSDTAPDDGASDAVKWLAAQMEAVSGKRMTTSTARTLLEHLYKT